MSENAPDTLTRRRLLRVFGVAGAALPVVAALPRGSLNAAVAAAKADDCGSPSDTGNDVYLWTKVQECLQHPPGTCLEVNPHEGVAVVRGSQGKTDFLLVPTVRIKGIECPKIWQPGAPNYWELAWRKAQVYLPHRTSIGLGINSQAARTQNQLHIHLAAIRNQVKVELGKHDHDITQKPEEWKNSVVTVLGRNYRVLRVADLGSNLFALLREHVATNDMRDQTLIVTARQPTGFYVLNSQASLRNGTSTCDTLLVYS
jgi:CDP-diacylglycerol pyrophosphatase